MSVFCASSIKTFTIVCTYLEPLTGFRRLAKPKINQKLIKAQKHPALINNTYSVECILKNSNDCFYAYHSARWHTLPEDGHIIIAVEMLTKTQYSVTNVINVLV